MNIVEITKKLNTDYESLSLEEKVNKIRITEIAILNDMINVDVEKEEVTEK